MILKGENISLRPLKMKDKEAIALLVNNKKLWDNLRDIVPHPYSLKDAEFYIGMMTADGAPPTFAIEYEGQFTGVIGLVPQSDVYKKTAEIGYWLGEPYWGKGMMSEAVNLITNYGLNELGFIRIHAGIFEYNIGSMKVLEKCGYQKDGIFKKSIFKNNKIWDEHRYSIVRENEVI